MGSISSESSEYLSMSGSSNSLATPPTATPKQQRRMTSPALPSDSNSLNPPPRSPGHQQSNRPPSPLRNGFIPDTFTGIDGNEDTDEDDDNGASWRSPSPTSSVSQFAASLAQRVGSFVGNINTRSLPTEAEIEAEAERERDRSRREAERILTQEAEERRLVEEKVLAMMKSTRSGSPKSLPPPPRSQTLPNPPSPSTSHKESGRPSWWIAAKNRLTPTKETLTPAQQVIQETKAREKGKKLTKGTEKEWPASSQSKFNDPAFLSLATPPAPPQRRQVPSSPSSPTPSHPTLPPRFTPSPMRSSDSVSVSPSREAPPLYAQFNAQGTLDVPGTLLAITKRFEKLEKWTISHVRALEDRMNDVERWLVEKEKEKEREAEWGPDEVRGPKGSVNNGMHEIREDLAELQGRVGELGREMAKLVTAPANLSSGPSRQPSVAPQPSPHTVRSATIVTSQPPTTPRLPSSTVRESTSPPMSVSGGSRGSRTRLPYPSGDYATSQDTTMTSPSNSPPASAGRTASISGLPSAGLGASPSLSASIPSQSSPPGRSPNLAVRKSPARSPAHSVSPTPRKRYTVALGGPIIAPPEFSEREQRPTTPPSSRQRAFGTALFSTSPGGTSDEDASATGEMGRDDQDEEEFRDDTIGKTAAAKLSRPHNYHDTNGKSATLDLRSSVSPHPSPPRMRAHSTYGTSPHQNQNYATTAPLALRARSHSTDRFGLGITDGGAGVSGVLSPTGSGKFVDPLLLRKQEKEAARISMPIPPKGKVPVGELVAFFDGDK